MNPGDTAPDLALERSLDPRAQRLVECLRSYAHALREDKDPARSLYACMMVGNGKPFCVADLPHVLRALAVILEQPNVDVAVIRVAMWVNHDELSLEGVTQRLERMSFSAHGTCS